MKTHLFGLEAIVAFFTTFFLIKVLMLVVWLILAWPVALVWNWLMPSLFSLPEISFWQALGLEVLCWLLLGSKVSYDPVRKKE